MQNNDAKNGWSSIKLYFFFFFLKNENEKQVVGDDGWKLNENYAEHNSVSHLGDWFKVFSGSKVGLDFVHYEAQEGDNNRIIMQDTVCAALASLLHVV